MKTIILLLLLFGIFGEDPDPMDAVIFDDPDPVGGISVWNGPDPQQPHNRCFDQSRVSWYLEETWWSDYGIVERTEPTFSRFWYWVRNQIQFGTTSPC